MLGPFSLMVWVIAGVFATVIALVFAYCSYYIPKVGGLFAYVSEAFDDFFGFLTGWSMWIAELISLPVFAIAFVRYLEYIAPLPPLEEVRPGQGAVPLRAMWNLSDPPARSETYGIG